MFFSSYDRTLAEPYLTMQRGNKMSFLFFPVFFKLFLYPSQIVSFGITVRVSSTFN